MCSHRSSCRYKYCDLIRCYFCLCLCLFFLSSLFIYLPIYFFRTIGDICKGEGTNAVIYRADPGLLIPPHKNTQQYQSLGRDFQITPNVSERDPDGDDSQKKQDYSFGLKSQISQNIPNSVNSFITEKSVLPSSTNFASAPFSQILPSKKFPPKNIPSLNGK